MLFAIAAIVAMALSSTVRAQVDVDRIGGDYLRKPVRSGDPVECALMCEHDRHCRSWTFSYPTFTEGALCWLKNTVPPRAHSDCCISGVRGAGVIEPRGHGMEMSTDRSGGDYRSFDVKNGREQACKAACTADGKCRAWSFARRGYAGKEARCFLKKEIKPPRRKPGFISGVVR